MRIINYQGNAKSIALRGITSHLLQRHFLKRQKAETNVGDNVKKKKNPQTLLGGTKSWCDISQLELWYGWQLDLQYTHRCQKL